MRVAVVGGGLAGVAVAWHALAQNMQVTLFDPKGIGAGASGVSTGLLHPYPGKTASLSWRAFEGMEATKELLLIAEEALALPVANRAGIFRPAVTAQQKMDFQKNKTLWTELLIAGTFLTPGLWIPEGITVFSRPYLKGLWLACEKKGGVLVQERFTSEELFDKVVFATGAETEGIESLKNFLPPLRTAVGQSLVCEWGGGKTLPYSLASQGYISVTEDPSLCQVGSTYEHGVVPDPQKAIELLDKVALFYPPAKDFRIVEIRAGKRIAPKEGHQPIITQVSEKTWVFTGLGSRGLLYHALLGKEVIPSIKNNSLFRR